MCRRETANTSDRGQIKNVVCTHIVQRGAVTHRDTNFEQNPQRAKETLLTSRWGSENKCKSRFFFLEISAHQNRTDNLSTVGKLLS